MKCWENGKGNTMRKNISSTLLLACLSLTQSAIAAEGTYCGESSTWVQSLGDDKADFSSNRVRQHAELRGLSRLGLDALVEKFDHQILNEDDKKLVRTAGVLDPNRSLYIRDDPVLGQFAFSELLDKLAVNTDTDGLGLFVDWWLTSSKNYGTHNPALACTDTLINGYPYTCSEPGQGLSALTTLQALKSSDGDEIFKIVAFVNRGDLWSGEDNSEDCGEYRIVAGADLRGSEEFAPEGIFLFNFEPALRRAGNGPGLCRAVQKLWASFTGAETSVIVSALRKLYFEGGTLTPDGDFTEVEEAGSFKIEPLLSAENLGLNTAQPELGQIRTNTKLVKEATWTLRDYRFRQLSDRQRRILPVGLANSFFADAAKPGDADNQKFAEAIRDAASHLVTDRFEGVQFSSNRPCLEAGEKVMGNGKDIKFILQGYLDNEDATKTNAVVGALSDLAATHPSLTTRNVFGNLAITTCVGCHRSVTEMELKHLQSPFGTPESSDRTFADQWRAGDFKFNRIDKPKVDVPVGKLTYKGYDIVKNLKNIFLPVREVIMKSVVDDAFPQTCSDLSENAQGAFEACSGSNKNSNQRLLH